jgi:hypothetical protein
MRYGCGRCSSAGTAHHVSSPAAPLRLRPQHSPEPSQPIRKDPSPVQTRSWCRKKLEWFDMSGRRNDRTGVWVAIAAYNEARAIAPVLAGLRNTGHDIVVVDDGSTDGTAEVAAAARAFVVRHSINLGQGAALQTGITFALLHGAEFIVTFDADGQHRAAHIQELVAALVIHHADFVLGSRFLGEGSNITPSRRLFCGLLPGLRA